MVRKDGQDRGKLPPATVSPNPNHYQKRKNLQIASFSVKRIDFCKSILYNNK